MNHNSSIVRSAAVVSLVFLVAGVSARAQSGSALMLSSWEEGRTAEVESDFLYQGQTETEDRLDRDVDLQWYAVEGRYRLAADERFRLSDDVDNNIILERTKKMFIRT